jgi:choline dehydrogenase-like flavoprotein
MIQDLRNTEHGTTFECDVCIIGAGAAGITIARQFIGRATSVILVESGGLEFEEATQQLYAFENAGLPRVRDTRYRYFGGTTNAWDGRCAPLSATDFAPRPWVAHSGWPLTARDLNPYHDAAHAECGLRLSEYTARPGADYGIELPALERARVQPHFWQFNPDGPLRFGVAHRTAFAESRNVRVLLHANATNLQAAPNGGAVEFVDIRTLEGVAGRIRARFVVLCCGGVENARLLLLSNTVAARGLGNGRDLVGRFLMDHPRRASAELVARDDFAFQDLFAGYRHRSGARLLLGVELGPDLMARQELLNCGALFFGTDDESSGTLALLRLLGRRGADDRRSGMAQDIQRVMADLDDVVINARRRFLRPDKDMVIRPRTTTMLCDVEQAPNPESRVTLTRERDALGLPKARLDWRVTDQERRTIRALTIAVAQEFGRLNLARVKLADWLDDQSGPPSYHESHHHMGTTRMAASPSSGVVSPDARVFGMDNLYVAGSSVFPTSGHVNPTLTIVMLSLRLADHLSPLV